MCKQISAKSKNTVCLLYTDVTPSTFVVPFVCKDTYNCSRGWTRGSIWKAESRYPYKANSQRAMSHTLLFWHLCLPISKTLVEQEKYTFPPALRLLSLAPWRSKAKEIPEPTSSEQKYKLKFSLGFCLCRHHTLILGNSRDYRETKSSASAGRLKKYEWLFAEQPFLSADLPF